jgi:hypothetical protein
VAESRFRRHVQYAALELHGAVRIHRVSYVPRGVPGGIPFLFFGILDLASSPQITNPSPWTVTRVDFFANADFTGLFESYTAAFTVGTSGGPVAFGRWARG